MAVHCIIKRQNRLHATLEASTTTETPASTDKEPIEAMLRNVACSQQETMKILKLAVPYTVSALTVATCSKICLIVLFHQWGDEESAICSQEFVRFFVWSVVLTATHNSICQLLIVAGHAYIGTIVSILIGLTNVIVSGLLVNTRESNLTEVWLT